MLFELTLDSGGLRAYDASRGSLANTLIPHYPF